MLYAERIAIKNTTSISSIEFSFPFDQYGKPKPLILVGENGTGKTTVMSFLVDALMSFAATSLSDALTQSGFGHLHFRLRIADQKLGSDKGYAYIKFKTSSSSVEYFDHDGSEINEKIQDDLQSSPEFKLLNRASESKILSANAKDIASELRLGAYCFFPSGRRETPHWLQERAVVTQPTNEIRFSNKLQKSIIIDSGISDSVAWVMDGLLDQSAGYDIHNFNIANDLIKIILEDPTAHFAIAPRNQYPRLQIYGEKNGERLAIIPSLSHLSAGQSMLFSMFATLVNHGTRFRSTELKDISGIAIIDEIEMYLHTKHQRTILQKLISLFPKIQFIITSHSPAFLVGMQETFGSDGIETREMPNGNLISIDEFTEIAEAIEAVSQSKIFREIIRSEVKNHDEGPVLFVEGKSDVIFIKGLWELWTKNPPPFQIRSANSRRALRYLLEDDDFLANVSENQRILGLFDFDDAYDDWNGLHKLYPEQLGSDKIGLTRKHVNKNVFAGLLPIPEIRSTQAGKLYKANSRFTIEMYLPNDQLSAESNLDSNVAPGNVNIFSFKGDKVAFANSKSIDPLSLSHFLPLLEFIKLTLNV